jgi:uncharacterized protein (TIGR03437 family)
MPSVTGTSNTELPAAVDRTGREAGAYYGTVTVVDQRDQSGKTVLVRMDVGSEAVIVGPESGQQEVTLTGDPAPAVRTAGSGKDSRLEVTVAAGEARTQTVHVRSTNQSAIPVVPAVQAEGDWLRLRNQGAVVTPDDLTLEIDPTNLTPGRTYTGFVTANWSGPQGRLAVIVRVAPRTVGVPVIEEISNAATLRAGAIAAGALFTIKGQGFLDELGSQTPCPAAVITQCFTSGLPLKRDLAGLQVLIDGEPAPLLFAGRIVLGGGVTYDQINALAPWSLDPGQAQVTVKRRNVSSLGVSATVAAAAPGVFTTQASGSGQGSITLGATPVIAAAAGSLPGAQPAKRGEAIVIWATGLGRVVKPGESGFALGGALYKLEEQQLARTPEVLIGGRPAQVYWGGIAPGFVGLYQVTAFVPQDIAPGERVPVQIRIGEAASRNDVTIAVFAEAGP